MVLQNKTSLTIMVYSNLLEIHKPQTQAKQSDLVF